MQIFLTILILIAAILLILIVIVQNFRGSDLAADFGENNKYMGVRKTTDFLERATWMLVGTMVVLSIASSFSIKLQVQGDRGESFIGRSQQSEPLPLQQPEATLSLPDTGTPAPTAETPAPKAQPETTQSTEQSLSRHRQLGSSSDIDEGRTHSCVGSSLGYAYKCRRSCTFVT